MDSRMYSMPRLAVFHPCPFLLNQNFLYVNAVGSSMKFPFYQCVFSGTRFSCLLCFLYLPAVSSLILLLGSALEETCAGFAWSWVTPSCTPAACLLEGRDVPTNPASRGLFGRARLTFCPVLHEKLLLVTRGPCTRDLSQQKLPGPTAFFKALGSRVWIYSKHHQHVPTDQVAKPTACIVDVFQAYTV